MINHQGLGVSKAGGGRGANTAQQMGTGPGFLPVPRNSVCGPAMDRETTKANHSATEGGPHLKERWSSCY